jgi:hypothetical protein
VSVPRRPSFAERVAKFCDPISNYRRALIVRAHPLRRGMNPLLNIHRPSNFHLPHSNSALSLSVCVRARRSFSGPLKCHLILNSKAVIHSPGVVRLKPKPSLARWQPFLLPGVKLCRKQILLICVKLNFKLGGGIKRRLDSSNTRIIESDILLTRSAFSFAFLCVVKSGLDLGLLRCNLRIFD